MGPNPKGLGSRVLLSIASALQAKSQLISYNFQKISYPPLSLQVPADGARALKYTCLIADALFLRVLPPSQQLIWKPEAPNVNYTDFCPVKRGLMRVHVMFGEFNAS